MYSPRTPGARSETELGVNRISGSRNSHPNLDFTEAQRGAEPMRRLRGTVRSATRAWARR
eukprot:853503-Lingulodinium_polyedra.AAC.1